MVPYRIDFGGRKPNVAVDLAAFAARCAGELQTGFVPW
jgi:hypothetical protein